MTATYSARMTLSRERGIAPAAKISAAIDSGCPLHRGIRNMLRCDEAAVVEGIAHYVISQHWSLRLLSTTIEKGRNSPFPGFIALIGWLRSFLSARSSKRRGGAVWIARLSNERRAIESFVSLSRDLNWNELKFRLLPDAEALAALFKSRNPRRIFRIVRRLHRRYEFFKVLRVIEFIGFYARYTEMFEQGNFKLALMSSHSNPHGVAFNLAARKFGIPVVLITHGMPIRPVVRLTYDLAVVHNEAARQTYAEEGCRMDRIIVHGRGQNYSAMPNASPESVTVGIFLCKDVNEHRVRRLTSELLNLGSVERVLIRPHPKNLWTGLQKWIKSLKDSRVILSSCGSVFDDIRQVDVVLGGNSSVLVDAVTAGRPAAFVANLDHGPPDLHCFVAGGLIYSFEDEGQTVNWNPDAMLQFYRRPEWQPRLKVFANIDEDQEEVRERAVAILRELAMETRSVALPIAVDPRQ
jgi:hypothetical protein